MNLSPGAAQFLRSHIGSPLGMDVLLVLYADPVRWWSAEELTTGLGELQERIGRVLDDLAIAGLLDVKVGSHVRYRFAPVRPGVASLVAEIAAVRLNDRGGSPRLIEPA